jgi:hypothetical protein
MGISNDFARVEGHKFDDILVFRFDLYIFGSQKSNFDVTFLGLIGGVGEDGKGSDVTTSTCKHSR